IAKPLEDRVSIETKPRISSRQQDKDDHCGRPKRGHRPILGVTPSCRAELDHSTGNRHCYSRRYACGGGCSDLPTPRPHGRPLQREQGYALRIPRVAAVPAFFPCHSAISKALFTSDSGKLCETTFDSGYLSFVRTRKSSAAGMI